MRGLLPGSSVREDKAPQAEAGGLAWFCDKLDNNRLLSTLYCGFVPSCPAARGAVLGLLASLSGHPLRGTGCSPAPGSARLVFWFLAWATAGPRRSCWRCTVCLSVTLG